MSKVIVTGASGFVGSYFSQYLMSQGVDTVSLRRSSGIGVKVNSYKECPKGDVIVHTAEGSNRLQVNQQGIKYRQESKEILKNLLEKCDGNIVYTSSCAVYGDKNVEPNTENSKVECIDLYNEIKLQNEELVLESGGAVLRLANIFGKGMSHENVISDICSQIPGVNPLKVRNKYPVRDFLSIEELCSAMFKIITSDAKGVFNIGSGEGIQIEALSKFFLHCNGEGSRRVLSTVNEEKNLSVNILNCTKIKKIAGWEMNLSAYEQLKKFIISEV